MVHFQSQMSGICAGTYTLKHRDAAAKVAGNSKTHLPAHDHRDGFSNGRGAGAKAEEPEGNARGNSIFEKSNTVSRTGKQQNWNNGWIWNMEREREINGPAPWEGGGGNNAALSLSRQGEDAANTVGA